VSTFYFTEPPDPDDGTPLPVVVLARCVRLCRPPDPEVLVLGYGLGRLGSLLAGLRPRSRILGIEQSADYHRRALATAPPNVELRRSDAVRFLATTKRRFDLVIDDCFRLVGEEPVRVAALDRSAPRVRALLRPGGVYARNLLPDDAEHLERSCGDMRATFRTVRLRRFHEWDNVIAIGSDRILEARELARLSRR
jgi:spermidine synthase